MAKFRKALGRGRSKSGVLQGPVRFARQPADIATLRSGDIALVSFADLDARQAHDLIEAGVVAVLNSAQSSTGRVPNQGPAKLSQANVALIDVSGDSVWSRLSNGDIVQLRGGHVLRDGVLVTSGSVVESEPDDTGAQDASDGRAVRLEALTTNASDHIRREQDMLLDGARIPKLRARIAGRPALVVVAGYDAVADLKNLKRYIAGNDPVIIAAGAGAEVLLDAGYRLDVLIGDVDNFSDRAIAKAGEVVVITATGTVARPDRLEAHGREIVTFTATGSDDDLAIVLADSNSASVIIHVGGPRNLSDILERAPSEAARLMVAKVRAGARLVDAKAVAQIASRPMSWWPVLLLLVAAVVALAAALWVTPAGQEWADQLLSTSSHGVRTITGGIGA